MSYKNYLKTEAKINPSYKIVDSDKEFEIRTNNMAEGAGKIKEMVTKALLESVNDLNMITR